MEYDDIEVGGTIETHKFDSLAEAEAFVQGVEFTVRFYGGMPALKVKKVWEDDNYSYVEVSYKELD